MNKAYVGSPSQRQRALPRKHLMAIAVATLTSAGAMAFEVDTDSDLKVRWDNSIKYTSAWRTGSADMSVANQNGAQPNTDFGDLNFSSGQQINDRFDLLSELDVSYHNFGLRISGDAWNDSVYTKGKAG